MPFAAVVELSSLNGTNGFALQGQSAGQSTGWSVSNVGDVNGDGIDDLAVGSNVNFGNQRGVAYIVFGRTTEFNAVEALSSLTPDKGFAITGLNNYDRAGFEVSAAGDINHDGIDDFIVGTANGAHTGVSGRPGVAYVVFGQTGLSSVNLASLNGTNGFRFVGDSDNSLTGRTAAALGDVNGDGIDDIIIGAFGAVGSFGAAYVVFGRDGNFSSVLRPDNLDGTNGFRIYFGGGTAGYSVSGGGDVSGDGFNDILLSAPSGAPTGAAALVMGASSLFETTDGLFFSSFDGDGLRGVRQVAGGVDVNGDGLDDIIVASNYGDLGGSNSGTIQVIFGRGPGFGSVNNLDALVDGYDGFTIVGADVEDLAGISISGAGDINDDGIDDFIIGANKADGHGNNSGAAYVVFGSNSNNFIADLSDLDGTNGFKIQGGVADSWVGRSVSAAGDVNGDGVDDIVIGAPNTYNGGVGMAYVIFGEPRPVNYVGGDGDDVQTGSGGADFLSGGAGRDTLSGGAGDDTLDGGDLSDILNGGRGVDTLLGGSGGDILSGDEGNDNISGGVGADKLFGGDGDDSLDGGADNDRFDGGAGIDTLLGGDGNDYLDGGSGADVMTGGAGNDVFIVDDPGDQAVEAAGGGYDIVRSFAAVYALANNIEALELQGSGDSMGLGNSLSNNLQGNSGANILSGGDGVDTINGNDGNDTIIGGAGNDLLRGGLGADTFVVQAIYGGVLEVDVIYDFSTAEGDRIDLSSIDANSVLAGDQEFTLVSAFTRTAGQMTLSFTAGQTLLRLDVNGDGKADYQMKINGDVTGDSGGWVL